MPAISDSKRHRKDKSDGVSVSSRSSRRSDRSSKKKHHRHHSSPRKEKDDRHHHPSDKKDLLSSSNHHHHHELSTPNLRRIEPNLNRSERSTASKSERSAAPLYYIILDEESPILSFPTFEGVLGSSSSLELHPQEEETKNISRQEQRRQVDEAFMMYTIAEKAAVQIQRNFRNRKLRFAEPEKDGGATVGSTASDKIAQYLEEKERLKLQEEEEEKRSRALTLCFISCGAFLMLGGTLLNCCVSIFNRCLGGQSADIDAPVMVDGAIHPASAPAGGTGGGGGGGAAPPPGLEAMAGQAAASASGAAGSGATAAAGAAAASSAAAAAGGAAAGAAVGQVVTAVAVSSAVAATAATASLVTNLGNTTQRIIPTLSLCGLVEPDVRKGKFTMIFEGFEREFDDREQLIVENLVVEAYNNLTIGNNLESVGCLDPLSREMTNAKLVNQTWDPIADGSNPMLETVFETTLLCDKCAALQPLFSQETEEERRLFQLRELQQEGEGTDSINGSDLLPASMFDFTSREFFQRMLQLVIVKTDDLSDDGELPEGFVQMTKAFVTPVIPEDTGDSDGESGSGTSELPPEALEDYLVTEIVYQPPGQGGGGGSGGGPGGGGSGGGGGSSGGGSAAFQFSYVDPVTGEQQTEIVVVDVETILEDPLVEPVPTTPFPTFGPTKSPTISPSSVPTIVFSGQPTREPSSKPSLAPSLVPSVPPSQYPSILPSGAPSNVPSIVPTEPPSNNPSSIPSDAPSSKPSIKGSIGPTSSPSISPSMVPSFVPSYTPSKIPSSMPSMVPSTLPSVLPSMIPSSSPSDAPSVNPSSIPSDSPSNKPSFAPSVSPSRPPSIAPSQVPSSVPTITTFHKVVCGDTGSCAVGTTTMNSNSLTISNTAGYNGIGVRCCSSTSKTGWQKSSASCPWTQSFIPTCFQAINWYDAKAQCETFGGRLCTEGELPCGSGSGCSHNNRLVWTSTPG